MKACGVTSRSSSFSFVYEELLILGLAGADARRMQSVAYTAVEYRYFIYQKSGAVSGIVVMPFSPW